MAALVAQAPLSAPSLGPTVLLFFETVLQPAACPRNTLYGHAIGIAAGWLSLVTFGLLHSASALTARFNVERIAAAALAVALRALGKQLVKAPHPPAAAITLIVSLGLLTTPIQLASLAAGIVLVTIAGWCTNHLLGVPMPLWGRVDQPTASGEVRFDTFSETGRETCQGRSDDGRERECRRGQRSRDRRFSHAPRDRACGYR